MSCSSPVRARSKVIEYPGACLAGEGVRHPDILDNLRLVVPELVAIGAVDLRHDELDVLGNQLALLPRHGLARLIASPHLCSQESFRLDRLIARTTCLPSSSVSQRVTQFCFVTFLHSGSIFTWGITCPVKYSNGDLHLDE